MKHRNSYNPFSRARWWLWLIALGVAVVVCAALMRHDSTGSGTLYRVVTQEVSLSLLERGQLVSPEQATAKVLVSGILQEVVETGTAVAEGDVLARVDDAEARDRVIETEREIERLNIRKSVTQKRFEKTRLEEQQKIDLDRKKLEHAQLELTVESVPMTPEERRLLEIDMALADLDVADAIEDYEHQKRLHDKGFVSASMLERFELRKQTSVAYREELAVTATLKEKGIPVERRIELEKNVQRQGALVERGEKAMARRLKEIEDEIAILDAQLTRETFNIERRREYVANTVLTTPAAGIAKRREYIDWRSGGKWAEYRPGVKIYEYDSIIDIINPARMQVALMVNEADIHLLTKDMPVTVRLPACPGRHFKGTLTALGGIGRDRFEVAQRGHEERMTGVTMFNATVTIENDDIQFHPGMSALAEFIIEPKEPRLVIPRQAVHQQQDNAIVYRKAMGGRKKVPIEGRVFNERFFLVTNGLAEGDLIYLDGMKEGS